MLKAINALPAKSPAKFALIQKKEMKTKAPPIRKMSKRYKDKRRLKA